MIPGTLLSLLLGVLLSGASVVAPVATSASPVAAARDRAVAFGLLLDAPLPPAVIDEAVRVADRLRVLYGIDTGNPLADREAAARRAAEFLEGLVFSPDEVRSMAGALGFSLDPAVCRSACRDIRALAEIELRRRALLRVLSPPDPASVASPCP